MRTTIRVDDEILDRLKTQARKENISVTRLINRTLRAGLRVGEGRQPKATIYRERACALGVPAVSLDKALALAATLEDEEIVRKLAMRK